MIKKYYKEMLLTLGLVVVLIIVNLSSITPINTEFTTNQKTTSPKISLNHPSFNELVKFTAKTFIKRLTNEF